MPPHGGLLRAGSRAAGRAACRSQQSWRIVSGTEPGATATRANLDRAGIERLEIAHSCSGPRGGSSAASILSTPLAVSRGASYMTSYNHSINTPMVTINRQLGFQTVFGRWQVHFSL